MVEKRFLIPVKRRWTLFILPFLALLYFMGVVTLVALDYEIEGVSNEMLALGGAGLFALVFLIELPFLFKRKVRAAPEPEPVREAAPVPVAMSAPVARVVDRDDEYVFTSETAQGLRVLEYSKPAKSRHKGAVYAKSFVPVTKEHVLRVETLAAEGREL